MYGRASFVFIQTLAALTLATACWKNPVDPSELNGERVLFIRESMYASEICVMDPAGSDVQVVSRYEYDDKLSTEGYHALRWSRDKGQIVLAGGPGSTLEFWPLWLLNTEGVFLKKLIWNGHNPYWIGNDTLLIYSRRRGYFSELWDIFRINVSTLEEDTLLFPETGDPGSNSGYIYTLYGVVPGRDTNLLLTELFTYQDSSGKKIDDDPEILLFDYSTGEKTYLTDNNEWEAWVRISPDGKHIVYTRVNLGIYPYSNNIFLMTIGGGNIRQLTTSSTESYSYPIWSPDGKYLMFEATNVLSQGEYGKDNTVLVMNIESGMADTVVHHVAEDNLFYRLMDWK